MMRKGTFFITMLLILVGNIGGRAQETAFPYPHIPDTISDDRERLDYLLTHFWSHYDFREDTAENRAIGEQGFVDFVNLMQYADSLSAAEAATAFADSICHDEKRLLLFDHHIEHYLANKFSPVRNDMTYAHLLKAMSRKQARYSSQLHLIDRNQVGTVATDFSYRDENGCLQRMHEMKSQLTLIVFYDPDCDMCKQMMHDIKESRELKANAFRLTLLYIKEADAPEVWKHYNLTALPSLYLLDHQKRVLVKDGTLEQVVKTLQMILN